MKTLKKIEKKVSNKRKQLIYNMEIKFLFSLFLTREKKSDGSQKQAKRGIEMPPKIGPQNTVQFEEEQNIY